jgi:hypothetical protein
LPDAPLTLNNRRIFAHDSGRLPEAEKAFSKALAIRRELAAHDPAGTS